jgi:hypothetical protein
MWRPELDYRSLGVPHMRKKELVVFYEDITGELKRIHIRGCRCNERPEAKTGL